MSRSKKNSTYKSTVSDMHLDEGDITILMKLTVNVARNTCFHLWPIFAKNWKKD